MQKTEKKLDPVVLIAKLLRRFVKHRADVDLKDCTLEEAIVACQNAFKRMGVNPKLLDTFKGE